MTAEAVKFSLDRHRTLKGSNRRSELDVGHRGGGGRSAHRPPAPEGAVLAARRAARRPRGHAGVAGRRQQARRQVRRPRRSASGPWQFVERVAQDRIVLERSPHYFDPDAGEVRPPGLPHHPRRQRAAGQPALRRHRHHAPGHADRRRQPQEGRQVRRVERDRARLQLDHDQPAQQDRQDQPARRPRHAARQRPAGARGARAVDRPRGAEPGGVRRPVHAGLRADRAQQRVLRQVARKCPTRDVARAKKLLADAGHAAGYASR